MPSTKRVLLVEDEKLILETLTDLLQSAGYIVKSAPEGTEAIKTLRLYRPHLIISDIMMPGMDGIALLERIKNNPEWNDIPVILLTAKGEMEDRIHGLKTGADAYLPKPFNIHELTLIIHNLIELKANILKGSGAYQQQVDEPADGISFNRELSAFLNQHYAADLSLAILAEHFRLSPSGFKKKLKRIYGKSVQELISQFRLEKAYDFLTTSSYNVSEVAFLTGFKSTAHFSCSFKKYFGITPSSLLS